MEPINLKSPLTRINHIKSAHSIRLRLQFILKKLTDTRFGSIDLVDYWHCTLFLAFFKCLGNVCLGVDNLSTYLPSINSNCLRCLT